MPRDTSLLRSTIAIGKRSSRLSLNRVDASHIYTPNCSRCQKHLSALWRDLCQAARHDAQAQSKSGVERRRTRVKRHQQFVGRLAQQHSVADVDRRHAAHPLDDIVRQACLEAPLQPPAQWHNASLVRRADRRENAQLSDRAVSPCRRPRIVHQ
jgi:hypothetical protein